jgi:hypothetical protein
MLDTNELNELYEFLQDLRADLLQGYNNATNQEVKDKCWFEFSEATCNLITVCKLQADLPVTKEAKALLMLLVEELRRLDDETAD